MVHAPERLPITLDNTSYFIEVTSYSRTTIPVLREQRDTSTEAGEQQLNTQMWIRSQTDWSYGSGQEFFDNQDSDRRRFHTSAGIDPWTKGQVSLLPITEDKGNTGNNVIMKVFVGPSDTYMYVSNGTALYYSVNFDVASPSWTSVTDNIGAITDFDSDGTSVFVVDGSAKIDKGALGATSLTSMTSSNLGAAKIRVISGRLIEMDGVHVAELAASGAHLSSSLDYDLKHGSSWVDAAAGPAGVYLASNTNDVGSVHFCGTDADGLLNQPAQVADLPKGETINAIESYGGLLVFATNKGFRFASMQEAGGILYGPLVSDTGAIYSAATDDRFVWLGAGGGQVYRADLSKFTESLVPAYASDVISTAGSPGNVTYTARDAGKTYFVDVAAGVQGEAASGNKVASGTMTVGAVRWNSQFEKVLRQIEVRSSATLATTGSTDYDESGETYDDADLIYDGLLSPVSGSINFDVTTGSGVALTQLSLSDRVPATIDYSRSDKYTLKFTLNRSSGTPTAAPILESWQIQAFASPTRIDEIVLPIVLKKRIASSRGMGSPIQQDPKALYDAIRLLMANKTVVTYQEGAHSEQVVVDQLQFAPDQLSADADWWEGTVVVRLLTVP
tara:strand:+ start:1712 stop:3562 length:1851 start_codon:yes stop_codon:yes gene_type:complete